MNEPLNSLPLTETVPETAERTARPDSPFPSAWTESGPVPRRAAWIDRLVLIAALVVLASGLWRMQTVVRWQLNAPFDLVFESPNLATIKALDRGINVYHPDYFNAPPFVFTLYTPLYHWICAALPSHPSNPFWTGRLVALGFLTFTLAGVWWATRARHSSLALLTMGLFLLLHPVTGNAAFLKNDSTALFFSVLALLLVRHGERSHRHLLGAAFCCVLAIAAKQVYVSASAACLLFLALQHRPAAWRFGLYYLLFAATGAVVAQGWWGSGFWFCVLNAPRMPFDAVQFSSQWGLMLRQPVFVVLMGSWLWLVLAGLRQGRKADWMIHPFFFHFLFAGAVLLLTVGKPGSSTNYFIEPSLAAVLSLGTIALSLPKRPWGRPALAVLCVMATFWELASARTRDYAFADPPFLSWRQQFHDALVADAHALAPEARPLRVLNLATASTFYDWPGETSVNDPFLYSLLWKHGVLDPKPLQQLLGARAYDLVVFRNGAAPGLEANGLGQIMVTLQEGYRPLPSESLFHYWIRRPGGPD